MTLCYRDCDPFDIAQSIARIMHSTSTNILKGYGYMPHDGDALSLSCLYISLPSILRSVSTKSKDLSSYDRSIMHPDFFRVYSSKTSCISNQISSSKELYRTHAGEVLSLTLEFFYIYIAEMVPFIWHRDEIDLVMNWSNTLLSHGRGLGISIGTALEECRILNDTFTKYNAS